MARDAKKRKARIKSDEQRQGPVLNCQSYCGSLPAHDEAAAT